MIKAKFIFISAVVTFKPQIVPILDITQIDIDCSTLPIEVTFAFYKNFKLILVGFIKSGSKRYKVPSQPSEKSRWSYAQSSDKNGQI